jgi:hypothetical protein
MPIIRDTKQAICRGAKYPLCLVLAADYPERIVPKVERHGRNGTVEKPRGEPSALDLACLGNQARFGQPPTGKAAAFRSCGNPSFATG